MRKVKPDGPVESKPPGTRELSVLLDDSLAAFRALTRRSAGAVCQWRRYGRKSPWVLKVSQGKRTLFYVTPKPNEFEVTVVLGQRAAEAALAGRVRASLHAAIRSAKRYVEGRPVRVLVRNEADLAAVEELVAVKLKPGGSSR